MNTETAIIENQCSQRSEIAAYIDGELLPREEMELEMHLAVCRFCGDELNEQKRLLSALDYALETGREPELPENFTKVIVANAESKVSGLRRPQERFKAFFACAALFLLVIIGLGRETKTAFVILGKFVEQIWVVGNFVWNLIYDIAFGTAIILRSLSQHILVDANVAPALAALSVFVLLLAFSRFVLRLNRA